MKLHRTTITLLAAVTLAAAGSGSVLAQEGPDERVLPSWFEIENLGPNGDDVVGEVADHAWGSTFRGDTRPDYWIVAVDSRASGNWTRHLHSDFHGTPDSGMVMAETSSHEIQNADGRWVGTGVSYGESGPLPEDGPPLVDEFAYAQLEGEGEGEGEGDYEGLTLVMVRTENSWRGVILPSDQIPPMPDPVLAD